MGLLETIVDLLRSGTPSTYILLFIIVSLLLREWDNFKKTLSDLKDKVNKFENDITHIKEKIDEIKIQLKELENEHRRYTQIGRGRIH